MKPLLSSTRQATWLVLGAFLGALGAVALVAPDRLVPPDWFGSNESLPPLEGAPSTDLVMADWPPSELKLDPEWQLLQYDESTGWNTQYVGAYTRLAEHLKKSPTEGRQVAIPLFPTVYRPDNLDKIYYDGIANSDIRPGDKVLVIGTGSGADAWAVSLKCRSKVYVVDINPLAVMNAQATARMGRFEIEAVVGDFQQVELPEGFRDFDYVLWNMPFVEVGATPENYQQRDFHDGDNGAVARRFVERLPALLKPDGKAIALNYALAKQYLNTPGTKTSVAPGDDPDAATTYMLFEIPNPATASDPPAKEPP